MKLGYAYFRSNLIKLGILSVAMPFILWDFFTGKDTKSEPAAIYLIIVIWVADTAFLVWQMVRAKRQEDAAAHAPAEQDRSTGTAAPGSTSTALVHRTVASLLPPVASGGR